MMFAPTSHRKVHDWDTSDATVFVRFVARAQPGQVEAASARHGHVNNYQPLWRHVGRHQKRPARALTRAQAGHSSTAWPAHQFGGLPADRHDQFVDRRLRSPRFIGVQLTQPCRSRTLTVFSELLSQLLKIGRSAVRPRPWPLYLTCINNNFLALFVRDTSQFSARNIHCCTCRAWAAVEILAAINGLAMVS